MRPTFLDAKQTMKRIMEGTSISRFGDGEMDLIKGENINFQKKNQKLADRLANILKNGSTKNCLVCTPDFLLNKNLGLTEDSKIFWREYGQKNEADWLSRLNPNTTYGDANVTRCYIRYKSSRLARWTFHKFKHFIKKKQVFVVEGEETRFGFNNDLLKDAKSISRIICPTKNAFANYDKIKAFCEKTIPKNNPNVVILIALGPCATVLAYDLSESFQALDIGHLDIEYEWFLRKTKEKIPIQGKFTNEVNNGVPRKKPENYEAFLAQVIKTITS